MHRLKLFIFRIISYNLFIIGEEKKNLKISVLLQIEQVKARRLSGLGFLTSTPHTHAHTY